MSESSERDPCDGRGTAEQKQEPANVFEGSSPAPRDQLVVGDGYLIEESRVGQEAAQDEASDADQYEHVADYSRTRGGTRRRTPSTLLAVTIAWSLSWIGLLLSLSGPFEHEVGYWSMLVSVGVVIVGSVVAWVFGRRTAHEPESVAGPEPPTEVPVS